MNVAEDSTTDPRPPAGWTAWPAGERPGRTGLLVALDLALAVAVGLLGGDLLWGATGLALLLIAQNRWFLPTTYELDVDALVANHPLRRRTLRWRDARRLVLDPGGGWIAPNRGRSRHGIDLYWGRNPSAARRLLRRWASRASDAGVPLEILPAEAGSDGEGGDG